MRWPIIGSLNSPYFTTESVTGRVLPLMVRSPVIVKRSCPAGSILVLLKVIVGYLSTSRRFDDRRSLSRLSLWVRILAACMVISTDDVSGLSGLILPVALTEAK